jgi:adenylate kinase family enzyme
MGDIAQELAKEDISKKLRKQLHEEQAALELELGDLDKQQTKGWILVDFPCSYAQAKLLEEALSGYKPLEEMEPTDREIETKRAL